MTYEEVSKSLNTAAMQLSPADLPQFLAAHADAFSSRPFTDYMRMKFQEKDISQQISFAEKTGDDPHREHFRPQGGAVDDELPDDRIQRKTIATG